MLRDARAAGHPRCSETRVSGKSIPVVTLAEFEATVSRMKIALLSIKRAGGYAGVSVSTVRRWIKDDCHRTYRAGRQHRIDGNDLVTFMRGDGGREP